MMSGDKGLNPHELAHKWVNDLVTRPHIFFSTATQILQTQGICPDWRFL